MIWSSVTRRVVSQPWRTVPSESPTKRQSTPAESRRRLVGKSYAVNTAIRRRSAFHLRKSGMVTGGASVGIPVSLGVGQVGNNGVRSVHNDLVSSPHGVVQALSRQVGVAATQVGEVPRSIAAIVFDQ